MKFGNFNLIPIVVTGLLVCAPKMPAQAISVQPRSIPDVFSANLFAQSLFDIPGARERQWAEQRRQEQLRQERIRYAEQQRRDREAAQRREEKLRQERREIQEQYRRRQMQEEAKRRYERERRERK